MNVVSQSNLSSPLPCGGTELSADLEKQSASTWGGAKNTERCRLLWHPRVRVGWHAAGPGWALPLTSEALVILGSGMKGLGLLN